MSEEIEETLELAKPPATEILDADKAAPPRCSRWATTSLWAGSLGLVLAVLAFALTEYKGDHSNDVMVIVWLLGIVACAVTLVSAVVGLIRIARSHGKRWGFLRAWLGLGFGFLTGAALFVWFVGMVARTFHW